MSSFYKQKFQSMFKNSKNYYFYLWINGMLKLIYFVPIECEISHFYGFRAKMTKIPLIDQTLTKLIGSQTNLKIHKTNKFYYFTSKSVFPNISLTFDQIVL